jgi:hypothetical protein
MTREPRFAYRVLVGLDEKTDTELKAIAKERKLSVSAVIRTLIMDALASKRKRK